MKYRWVSIHGEFDITEKGDLFFRGSAEDTVESEPLGLEARRHGSIGIILSDQELIDGFVSADVSFVEVDEASACELLIGYDTESRSHLAAGITAFKDAMFAIQEWTGFRSANDPSRWISHAACGDRRNLKSNQVYNIRVDRVGTWIQLSIDGVAVAAVSIPANQALRGRIGIWCLNNSGVEIANIKSSGARPRAFIVMQFSEPYNQVYSEVIRAVCGKFDLQTVRADEVYGPGLIIRDVVDQIVRAQVIIADITPANPNVYFEVGYALALNKPIILLAKKDTRLPFDVSAFRVLFYEDSIGGKTQVERDLEKHLAAIFGNRSL